MNKTRQRLHLPLFALCAVVLCAIISRANAASNKFLLITDELRTTPIRLISFDRERIRYVETATERTRTLSIDQCIALLKRQPVTSSVNGSSLLLLADGRRFPGEPATPQRTASDIEVFAWHSSWLGRLDVPLDEIDSIILHQPENSSHASPSSERHDRRGDIVHLVNGDVIEGFVAQIGNRVVLEVDDGARAIEIPRDRIAAIHMVAAPQAPSREPRAWLADGTIMNVEELEIDAGGMARVRSGGEERGTRLDVRHVSAVLLSPSRMSPLADLEPAMVSGPETRYIVLGPQARSDDALLGLSPVELRGPVTIEYRLPARADRFAAEFILPEASRHYGDFEVVIRSGPTEVFRRRLNAANPSGTLNVPLEGDTLTIELTSGPHGAIHNHLVLNRAMLRLGLSSNQR